MSTTPAGGAHLIAQLRVSCRSSANAKNLGGVEAGITQLGDESWRTSGVTMHAIAVPAPSNADAAMLTNMPIS
jgi:hypothetical protein